MYSSEKYDCICIHVNVITIYSVGKCWKQQVMYMQYTVHTFSTDDRNLRRTWQNVMVEQTLIRTCWRRFTMQLSKDCRMGWLMLPLKLRNDESFIGCCWNNVHCVHIRVHVNVGFFVHYLCFVKLNRMSKKNLRPPQF